MNSIQSGVMSVKHFTLEKVHHFEKYLSFVVRNKSFNSNEWLKRRESDVYIEKAKLQNYRCRSAFKLLDIDNRYKLLQPGLRVVDIGAAPGSWSQVMAERTNSHKKDPDKPAGLVIAVDLQLIHPIEGVIVLPHSDFTKESTQSKMVQLLGEQRQFDCVFSDMAPPSSGVRSLDQENILKLVFPVIVFAVKWLKPGGSCVAKLWDGNLKSLEAEVARFFKHYNFFRPAATYTSSSEVYLIARNFLGLKT